MATGYDVQRGDAEESAAEMAALLRAGAAANGTYTMRAAIHLLTFTELVQGRALARHIEIEATTDRAGRPVRCGFVASWPVLMNDPAAVRMGSTGYRLLTLAHSFARGSHIDMRDACTSLGHAHATRVVEAVAIATGLAERHPDRWPWWDLSNAHIDPAVRLAYVDDQS